MRADGGAVLAMYREPLGGHALLLTALPIEKVAPTPFQRDISDAHVRRLTVAMDKTKRFLDPIIAVRERTADAQYWTPNGYQRLAAMKELGAKTILALLVPERVLAYQILALNIEKAHNLREKAIGVRRMGRVFWIAALWAVAWNVLGAVTFEREKYGGLYSHDPNGLYQAD